MQLFTFDNTDPDGMDLVLAKIGKDLNKTLCVVVSKSGGTKETRNGMLEAKAAYEAAGLNFGSHAVAITQAGSELDKFAVEGKWLKRFPMWDWVGGRTSELSAVGLLPAALQGLDVPGLLAGAKACDEQTRKWVTSKNPAALLALAWYAAGNGKGEKAMVVLPYKDRLELFSKYLQQLVMESLGKEKDVSGNVVHQGLSVFGNKGSTDQHAYVQQLRDGLSNFFVTFIEVLRGRSGASMEVESGVRAGDYLSGFFLGTRRALFESGRESLTITVNECSAFSVGLLIALFERAVGFYASLININAYHQPGVEAGKKAAGEVIKLQLEIQKFFGTASTGATFTAREIGNRISSSDSETIFKVCQHLAANAPSGIVRSSDPEPAKVRFSRK
jgi:glucose-6-phosphate isomerase